MSEDFVEKFNKSMMDEIHEIRQLQKDIEEGKISDSEFKAKMAELDRSYKEKKKRFNNMVKEIKDEARLNKK